MSTQGRSISGLVALVTGAGSGMGRATAELFAAEGARVAVTDQSLVTAQAVAIAIGGSSRAWKLDVADAAEIAEVVGAVAAHFGRLDLLVNNAGIAAFRSLDDVDYDEVWLRVLNINLTAQQRPGPVQTTSVAALRVQNPVRQGATGDAW